jgi:hypothetical protein
LALQQGGRLLSVAYGVTCPASVTVHVPCDGSEPFVVSEDGARIVGVISDRGIMNAIADHGVDRTPQGGAKGDPMSTSHGNLAKSVTVG